MFKTMKKIRDQEAELERLRDRLQEAKNELADVKHQKKIEEEDIKHMVRLKEERMEAEKERYQLKMEREKDAAITKVRDEYRDKVEKNLEGQLAKADIMYKEILARLPDVNVKLSGKV